MIAKSSCQHCGGGFEFDIEQFDPNGGSAMMDFGQTIDCPHCGKKTIIALARKTDGVELPASERLKGFSKSKPFDWKKFWIIISVLLIIIAGITWLGICIYRNPGLLGQIGAGGISIAAVILACVSGFFALVIGVMWVVFPWLVYTQLEGVRRELKKIEENTRK